MKADNRHITTQKWELEGISISHNIIHFTSLEKHRSVNELEAVRLHFGLKGDYDFSSQKLQTAHTFTGHHNNIMYSDGLDLEVCAKSKQIETFGVNFTPDSFVQIAQHGNDALKRLVENVIDKKNAVLSDEWRPNSFKIHQVINEILHCRFGGELKKLFLLSKSIELLVLQAALYEAKTSNTFIKTNTDKRKLFEAKEILTDQLGEPPTIYQLSKLVALNEYKLKKGFKELFGTTIFGYIHHNRMCIAQRLLLDTQKSAKEIAYEIGYSSPQHFSKAFKKEFGKTPDSIRRSPDSTL
ncbi:helix-turn-helix transcriptional regulator [Aquimarina hainanensis]|uniref:Helix-turn-helix transcriptional regulator n=1 Tax=Aquimarina hainanensis TaxID=1578017 RepID=A0ABW5NG66_9FLAO